MASTATYFLALSALFNALNSNAQPINTPLLDEYDYVVVGGGAAGLTIANRLSADPSVTVLVLEAGPADQGEQGIEVPVYMGSEVGTQYDWNLSTVNQVYLNGQPRAIPQGHGLGGGTLINGMLWNRGGVGDYSDWEALGNPGWAWSDLLPYFRRSETYTPPTQADDMEYFMSPDMSVHGTDGPVQVSYPNWLYNETVPLYDALSALGVPTASDVNAGEAGITFLPLDLDPATQTRFSARRAYYDPVADRTNLYVSTGQVVTRVLFDNAAGEDAPSSGEGNGSGGSATSGLFGSPIETASAGSKRDSHRNFKRVSSNSTCGTGLHAIGVEYAPNSGAARMNVTARREVILSAGSFHSPQLLQLSGIGPESILSTFGIPVLNALAGVGYNLQDHYMIDTYAPYNVTSDYILPTLLTTDAAWNSEAAAMYAQSPPEGPYTLGSPDGDAFPSLPSITGGDTTIADNAAAQSADQYLADGLDPSILAGYAAQHALLVNALRDETRGVYELLNGNQGTMTLSNMRPFSRGNVQIGSADPFQPPVIDPRYGSNPTDIDVLLATLHFNEQILQHPAMQVLQPIQSYPTVGASDAELTSDLANSLRTEYHPSGTCAMMPLEFGGVVDPNLLVYGTQNLRVVDASVFPMLPASHLQAVVYGVAEKAADIIIAAASTDASCSGSSSSNTTTTTSSVSSGPTSVRPSSGFSWSMNATSTTASATSTGTASSLSSLVSSAVSSQKAAGTGTASGLPTTNYSPTIISSTTTISAETESTPVTVTAIAATVFVAPQAPASLQPTGIVTGTPSTPTAPAACGGSTEGSGSEYDHSWYVQKAKQDFGKLFGLQQPFFIVGN